MNEKQLKESKLSRRGQPTAGAKIREGLRGGEGMAGI